MANEHLKRTPTSTGNRKVWTFSCWIKLASLTQGERNILFGPAGSVLGGVTVYQDSGLRFAHAYDPSGTDNIRETVALYRDPSAWYHVVWWCDTTQVGTRWRIYVNGVEQTLETPSVANGEPAQNIDLPINAKDAHYLGGNPTYGYFSGKMADVFMVDGQALTPDVFGFYKEGKGYISAGSTQATDFRPGQWVPKAPRVIKSEINRRGGFGVNGYYLPMNDSTNFGADFHTTPNSIIKLQEDLQQPKVSIASTAQAGLAYTDVLRADPYASNLVLAMPFITGGSNNGYGDYSADIKGSGSNKTVTATGSNLVVGLTSALYYDSALVDTNSTSDYLTVTGSGTDFRLDPAQEDWTVEFWVNPYTRSAPRHTAVLTKGSATANNSFDWRCYVGQEVSVDYVINFGIGGNSGNDTSDTATDLPPDQWTHFAFEAHNGSLTKYINGVAVGVNTNPRAQTTNHSDLHIFRGDIGAANDVGFIGGLQDLRIYSGVAKYKGGFDVVKPYAPVGFSTWRAVPDTPANNFATLNAVDSGINGTGTLSDGNLTFASNNNVAGRRATIGFPTTGEYYWETRISSATGGWPNVGILKNSQRIVGTYTTDGTTQVRPYGADSLRPYLIFDTTDVIAKVSDTALTGGDIIQCAWSSDGTDGKLWFGINDQWYGYNGSNVVTLTKAQVAAGNTAIRTVGVVTESWSPVMYIYRSEEHNINFGQNPTFSTTINAGLSTFTDSNGKGLFRYEPPTDFLALCEDNLPTPAISDPGDYFKSVLYTGNGSARSITGIGFTPDLVWVKERTATSSHELFNSIVGPARKLNSDSTNAESINTNSLRSFDNDGFSVGSGGAVNESGQNYVAWCWQAGAGTTSTNTDGSINSVVSVNQDAGFSIVSYNGTGSAGTIGHGLGKTPGMIICKSRDSADAWPVWHKSFPSATDNFVALQSNGTIGTISNYWNSSAPNTTTFGVAGGTYAHNLSGDRMIAYCWAEIEGFSKFGSYIGDDRDDDGVFVYCGFKPAMVIIKNTTTSSLNWHIIDSSRSSSNPAAAKLYPNVSDIENATATDNSVDFLSNGFKLRGDVTLNNATNGNGDTMIFAAFAESPFKTANAK